MIVITQVNELMYLRDSLKKRAWQNLMLIFVEFGKMMDKIILLSIFTNVQMRH